MLFSDFCLHYQGSSSALTLVKYKIQICFFSRVVLTLIINMLIVDKRHKKLKRF